MYTVERLRKKLSPLEDRGVTDKVAAAMVGVDLTPYLRRFKGEDTLVLSLKEMWEALFPNEQANLHDYTVLGRSLQALLWERSYLQGGLVFTKTPQEVEEDGF